MSNVHLSCLLITVTSYSKSSGTIAYAAKGNVNCDSASANTVNIDTCNYFFDVIEEECMYLLILNSIKYFLIKFQVNQVLGRFRITV